MPDVTSRTVKAVAAVLLTALVASGCGLVGGGSSGYKLVAYFDRAVSLYPSSQVRVLGLPAGTIDKVEVIGNQVKVSMTMQRDVPIPQGVHAQIVPQSLIGERYVQLMPAWQDGQPKAGDGYEIPRADTITPVEPDEALAAVKKFLDALDPKGLGRLINNADDALHGNGAALNSAFDQVSRLVATFAEKDQTLVAIVDSFDQLTTTLRTRESQLGDIMGTFAQATQVLADERGNLEALLASLSSLSTNGLQLVAKHSQALRTDLDTLARLTSSITTNLDTLARLLDSGPQLIDGLATAYNPDLRAMNLRTSFSPLAQQLLNPIFQKLLGPGVSVPCLPVDVLCQPTSQTTSATSGAAAVTGQAATNAVPATLTPATTPIDDLLAIVAAPTVKAPAPPTVGDRAGDGIRGFGSFLADAGRALVGAS